MINQEVLSEVAETLNDGLEKLSEKYGNLYIKIDVIKVKKKMVTLKIDIVTEEGKVIAGFDSHIVMAGDTINLSFGDHKFLLKDIIYFS